MAEHETDPESPPTELSVDRRTFLRLGVSAAAGLLATGACADDTVGGDGDGESGTGTDTDQTGAETGDGDGDGDPTGDGDGDGDPTGDGDGDGDGDPCEGTLIEFDPDAVLLDEDTFPFALLSGEMRPTSVMLAIYVEDAAPKLVRVWRTSNEPGIIELIAEAEVVPSADGYAKLTIEGLCPGTWYRYAYFVGDEPFTARSPIAEVRTAIAEDSLEPLVVAMTACPGDSYDWPALDRTAQQYYDIFLDLGDLAYNDGALSLQEFRDSWRPYMEAEGYKQVFAKSGMYATWDDHEVMNNNSFDPETQDPVELERKKNAFDSFFELLPIDGGAPDYKLWRSFRWGLTAEFIVLDCRYERKASIGEYMSPEQMAWLQQTLLSSPCHFKVVLNSVPITDMPLVWDLAANDRWEGFPDSRAELLGFIDANQIDNVWFLSGDFHVCFVSRLEAMGASLSARTREITVTGGRTNVLGDTLTLSSNFEYGRGSARGCVLTFDPATDSVNVRFINTNGTDDYNQDLTQD